jgi:hypothetical protein
LSLAAGSYVFTGKVALTRTFSGGEVVTCALRQAAPAQVLDTVQVTVGSGTPHQAVVHSAATLSGTGPFTIEMVCNTESATNVSASNRTLAAIKVGSLQ